MNFGRGGEQKIEQRNLGSMKVFILVPDWSGFDDFDAFNDVNPTFQLFCRIDADAIYFWKILTLVDNILFLSLCYWFVVQYLGISLL